MPRVPAGGGYPFSGWGTLKRCFQARSLFTQRLPTTRRLLSLGHGGVRKLSVTGRLLCPSCQEVLVPVDREGVEIDYCPNCRGVWLDRGELDKILDRVSMRASRERQALPPRYEADYVDEDDRYRKRKKRKSFLEELFDFD